MGFTNTASYIHSQDKNKYKKNKHYRYKHVEVPECLPGLLDEHDGHVVAEEGLAAVVDNVGQVEVGAGGNQAVDVPLQLLHRPRPALIGIEI